MERKLSMDTQNQNFWKESITKEDLLRLCWMRRFQGDLRKSPARGTERKKVCMVPRLDFQAQEAKKQEKEETPAEEAKGEKLKARKQVAKASLVDMRPVTPEVRALLYDGFSNEDKGRYQYLKARTEKGPHEKYEFALASSWDYGWNLGERPLAEQG
uniref:protein SPMIP1-like n=1 Tax=Pristiophorus japonicus TaxID=55135 RepID=UPI00398F1F9F